MSEGLIRPSPFLMKKDKWLIEGQYCFVFENEYPVTPHHGLIVPKREIETMRDMTVDEWAEIQTLAVRYVEDIKAVAFNLGHNGGQLAGQSVAHVHFHVFPHFEGGAGMPKGGYCAAFGALPEYYQR